MTGGFSLTKEYRNSFGVIASYIRKYRREFSVLTALGIISAAANAAVPFLAGRIIDFIITPREVHFYGFALPGVFFWLAAWFIPKLLADFVDWEINHRSEKMETFIEASYLAESGNALFDLPLAFHKKQKMGEVREKINRAAGYAGQITSRILITLAPQFLSIFMALAILFAIKPVLAGILFAAVLVYAFLMLWMTSRLGPLQRAVQRAWGRAYGASYDAVINIETVKQAVAEEYEKRRHRRNFLGAANIWINLVKVWQRLTFTQRILVSLVQGIIFLLSIYFINSGAMTVGELVAFNGYAAMLFGPFVTLGHNWQALQNGFATIEISEKILRLKPETYEPNGVVRLKNIAGDIEFRNVWFRYENSRDFILEDISATIPAGTTVALVGESGVGKTTFVNLLSFYHHPARGKIFIDGRDAASLNLKEFRSRIAVVPQEIILFNDTIKNNIRYGKFVATDEEVREAARAAHADEFIESFPKKYNQLVGERGIKLSTGQKQRLAIARAILRDPRILILDEPTSALDAKSEKFITESLGELMRGRTTFIIAHRLSTVRKADMILVFENGSIVERGTHEELMNIENGVYRRLYELQIGLHQ